MAKTWVLDTETKGTGAHIAPLRRDRGASASRLDLVQLHPPADESARDAREDQRTAQAVPKRFRIIDVLTRRVLADDVRADAALAALADARSPIDVLVYVREPERARERDGVRERDGTRERDGWRLLTLAETRALWELRERLRAHASSS